VIVGLVVENHFAKYRFVKFVDEDGVKRNVSQYLVVAQVCKQLRRVVLEADFWQDPDFYFSGLLEERQLERYGRSGFSRAFSGHGVRVGGLVKALLDDEYLVNCLKRRRSWLFNDSEVLSVMVTSGNWFSLSVEAIAMDLWEWQAIPALRLLSLCPQMVELDISVDNDYSENKKSCLDLRVISQCLPSLRKLEIESGEYKGSLEGLGSLTALTVKSFNLCRVEDSHFLPLASRSTLKSLRIAKLFLRTTDTLHNFSNLIHLTCEDLQTDLVELFKSLTNIRLHSLQLQISFLERRTQLGALQSLTKLRQLHLEFYGFSYEYYDDPRFESEMQVISRYVLNFGFSHLHTLEHLRLYGGFDLAWCRTLASLKSLKCLELGIVKIAIGCTVAGRFYLMKDFPQLEGLRMDFVNLVEVDDLTAILEKEFEWISKIKIFYVKSGEDFERDLSVDHFHCLCGGSV